MNRLLSTAAVLIMTAVNPASSAQLVFDTGTPPSGTGSIGSYISSYRHNTFSLVFTDSDYRIETASVHLEGRALFTLRISEASSVNVFPDSGTLLSTGSFKRPDSWNWTAVWCPIDLTDFTMVKDRAYWFEFTSMNSDSGSDWLEARLIASSYKRADWNGSSWSWLKVTNKPNYVPSIMLYGYAVPEPSSSPCAALRRRSNRRLGCSAKKLVTKNR